RVRGAARALDGPRADGEAQAVLAAALGDGPEAEQLLRAAVALAPSSADDRDRLALALFRRGERTEGAAELEESVLRAPALRSHPLLLPARTSPAAATAERALGLAQLEPEELDAVERGLSTAP